MSWTRNDKLVLLGLVVAVLTLIVGALVVPEIRRFFALDEAQQAATESRETSRGGTVPTESVREVTSLTTTGVPEPPIEPVQVTSYEETPTSSTSEPSQGVVATEEEAGFRFDLRACRRSVSEITCDFLITNNWDDRYITLCARCFANVSRLVDTDGNEYHGEMATLGAGRSEQPQAALTSGVPLKASITFGGARNASGVKLLEVGIRVRGRNGGHFAVRFHDVPLSST